MKEHSLEEEVLTDGGPEPASEYGHYRALGGIINERDCRNALAKARETTHLPNVLIRQAELIARHAGIALHNSKDALDPITILYGILRTDEKSDPSVKFHHGQMSDQRIFAEALRLLGEEESLRKLLAAYPNVTF